MSDEQRDPRDGPRDPAGTEVDRREGGRSQGGADEARREIETAMCRTLS